MKGKKMTITLIIIGFIGVSIFIFLQQPQFGRHPSGERLEIIKKSPNYENGAFKNTIPTSMMSEDASYFNITMDFIFGNGNKLNPKDSIKSIINDLFNLDKSKDLFIWFGHSSYFFQIDGKTILVDPVLCGYASPVSFTTKAYKGSDIYSPEDMPEIDYLFITHDHYDHLDYESVTKLKDKVKNVICPLGVGEHMEYWGYDVNIITEMDWYDKTTLDSGFEVQSIPTRHFSGRAFTRNKTLWTAFALKTEKLKLFIGGDGGYCPHFKEAKELYGGFDYAMLENGQYNKNWQQIHTLPEEFIQASKDLKTKNVVPVHSSKFTLGLHDWDEPLKEVTRLNDDKNLKIVTPIIGEIVDLNDSTQIFSNWWEDVN